MSAYIRAIRNPAKKAYAKEYLTWLQGGEQGDPPERGTVSYMAAQAVRMALRDEQPNDPREYLDDPFGEAILRQKAARTQS